MVIDVPDLRHLTLDYLHQVPRGKVTTYRALALALGDVVASRAVGQILAEFEALEEHPSHRVIYNDGQISPYGVVGGRLSKADRLRAEGIPIVGWRVQHFEHYLFECFRTERPLLKLRKMQSEISQLVSCEPLRDKFRTAGGVDLSYRDDWHGVGAYVLMNIQSQEILSIDIAEQQVAFPYIPSYLAFRELPVLLSLLETARDDQRLADVILVDGSGILHPRQVGLASHLGVILNLPTIGVTKSKLYGEVSIHGMKAGEVRAILDPENGRKIGAAIKTTERADPIYVSVGHGITLEMATDLVLRLSIRKLPVPIERAHQASREMAQGVKRVTQQSLDL
ncbi:endonuclease V [Candidatus Acetothermia bacterium]|nr:endonuclease V [Candidatus Acetothermia bacterium]MBI3644042.1 endonuclease V [Candidatus Acetothermia bacterium]